jgi:SAM-dependent methyltransferase
MRSPGDKSARLRVVMLYGPTGSGKSFITERVLGVEYDVTTHKLDRIYRDALASAGLRSAEAMPSVLRDAKEIRSGKLDPEILRRFWKTWEEEITRALERARDWGVAMVFEGYTLRFADEATKIAKIGRRVSGRNCVVSRILVKPSLGDFNRNLAIKRARLDSSGNVADQVSFARQMEPAKPVAKIDDYIVGGPDEIRRLANDTLKLRRHSYYQRFSLGPLNIQGVSDASEKVEIVQDPDVIGKRVLDLCCNIGAHSFMLKDRGARKVVGVEMDPVRYCKALELQKTLIRHSIVDAYVDFCLGEMMETLPTIGRFDTTVLFGAMHYFQDYEATLREIARVTDGAAYIEFTFSELEHDTANSPPGVHPYMRSRTGTTIYLADPMTVERIAGEAGFEVDARVPTQSSAAAPCPSIAQRWGQNVSETFAGREVWRLRRRSE